MTWLMNEQMELPQRRGPGIAPPSNWQGLSAAVQMEWQDANIAGQRERQVVNERDSRALQAVERLGETGLAPLIAEFNERADANGLTERRIEPGMKPDEIMARLGSNGSERVLELARDAAASDPASWADLDLSDEGIEKTVTERRKKELEVNQELLNLSPSPVRNQLLGTIAGAVVDPINLALAPLGAGGGSILRTMGREAWLGMAAEGLQFQSRLNTAQELGKEAPDLFQSLMIGAVGGAVLGGAIEALPPLARGLFYAGQAKVQRVVEGVQARAAQEAALASERAVFTGDNPLDAVMDVLSNDPAPSPEPREPLIPRSVTATTPEPTPLAPDPITTEVLPPRAGEAPQTDGELAAMAETALNDAVKRDNKPFLRALKRGPGIDPNGEIAKELKAMGVNARSYPGLFKKGGARDLDNLVASEWDESIPGLSRVTGMSPDGMYLDRNGVIQAIIDEAQGIRLRTDAEMAARSAEYTPKATTEIEDFTSGARADDGFYMEPDPLGGRFSDSEYNRRLIEARQGLGDYAFRKGIRDMLPNEMEEIARELALYGGDAKFLIERAIGREIDEIKRALEAPDGTARATGGEDRGGQRPAEEPAPASGAAGSAGDGAVQPQGTGGQLAIPGTERTQTGDAQRLAAEAEARRLQSKIRRLDQVRVEDDVDSLFATKQLDIFDDVTSADAGRFMDANLASMRAILDTEGDLPLGVLEADDGTSLNSLSDVLNEIEEMDKLAAEFAKCRKGVTNDGV